MSPEIHGHCSPAFQGVRQAFERNFSEQGELGAAIAVSHHGELVVDLWGGWRDPAQTLPWEADTLVCTMSVVKAFSALCIHRLIDEGDLALDDPVARFWPEFGAQGKADIPIRWVLCHLAGIPVADAAQRGDLYDWEAMTQAIAAQAPLWPPGTTRCYHSSTQGFILGELVRRVTGQRIGRFFDEQFAQPFGLDFHIGLDESAQKRCADLQKNEGTVFDAALRGDRSSLLGRGWYPLADDETFNSVAWREAEIPSANGHGTARSIARLYGVLAAGGTRNGKRMIGQTTLEQAVTEQWRGPSISSQIEFRTALGFFLNHPPHRPMGPNASTFGHSGAGGAQGFGDPDAQLGFGYSPNRMHGGLDIGIRAACLIEATYESLNSV